MDVAGGSNRAVLATMTSRSAQSEAVATEAVLRNPTSVPTKPHIHERESSPNAGSATLAERSWPVMLVVVWLAVLSFGFPNEPRTESAVAGG